MYLRIQTLFFAIVIILGCLSLAYGSKRRQTVQDSLASPETCERYLLDADRCVQRLILIGNETAVIPRNKKELQVFYCDPFPSNLQCIRRYGNECLRLFPKTMYGLLVNNVRKIYKDVCKTTEGQESWITHASCLQPSDLPVLHKYFNLITTLSDYVVENVKADDVVPWACCAWFSTFEKIETEFHSMCDAKTGPATTDFFMSLIKAVSSEAVDIACGKYSSRDLCDYHFKPGMQILDSLPIPQKNYSMVVPIVGIIKLLDSQLTTDGQATR